MEEEFPKLKNEFRDEIRDPYAGIPEDELVTRDQAVLMKELRARKFVRELNNTSLDMCISKAKELRAELLAMQKSPYREICIANAGKMIENNQNVLKANRFPIESELTLLALEELFAEKAGEAYGEKGILSGDETNTGRIAEPTTPTSVETEVDDESPELSDEDDPEEVI